MITIMIIMIMWMFCEAQLDYCAILLNWFVAHSEIDRKVHSLEKSSNSKEIFSRPPPMYFYCICSWELCTDCCCTIGFTLHCTLHNWVHFALYFTQLGSPCTVRFFTIGFTLHCALYKRIYLTAHIIMLTTLFTTLSCAWNCSAMYWLGSHVLQKIVAKNSINPMGFCVAQDRPRA